MQLIDFPEAASRSLYEDTISLVVKHLIQADCARAIFQIGGVGHPGVSDIDIVMIAYDRAEMFADPLRELSAASRRLFTHGCLLVSESSAAALMRYTTFHNFVQLHGAPLSCEPARTASETADLEHQIGIEFLIKNWIDLETQLALGVLKVRAFLQHVKALRYDLQFLKLSGTPLHDVVTQTMVWLDDWFDNRPTGKDIISAARRLCELIEVVIADETMKSALPAPSSKEFRLSRNTVIRNGDCRFGGFGLSIPRFLGIKGRKYFNLNYRLHRFAAYLPLQDVVSFPFLSSRISFFREAKKFTQQKFPYFAAPISPLYYFAV